MTEWRVVNRLRLKPIPLIVIGEGGQPRSTFSFPTDAGILLITAVSNETTSTNALVTLEAALTLAQRVKEIHRLWLVSTLSMPASTVSDDPLVRRSPLRHGRSAACILQQSTSV